MDTVAPDRQLLFLSDAHLGGFNREQNNRIERELIHVVDYCQRNRIKIYILGDLFDYWMEYPGHIPALGEKLRSRFRDYNRELGPTLYITGNHDNWIRSHFRDIGFATERDFQTLQLDGKNVLLLHGDGLPEADGTVRRPPMHRLLRNGRFVRFYQNLFAPQTGLHLMKWFSRINRVPERLRQNPDKLNRWAEHHLEATDIDLIICGHDHVPRVITHPFGTYFNLGTFYKQKTAVLYNNRSADLVVWNDERKQFINYHTAAV